MNPIISATGKLTGKGSQRFKSVKGLTEEEKQAVIDGKIVLVRCPWSDHPSATEFKQVTTYVDSRGRRQFGHRNFHDNTMVNENEALESQRKYEGELDEISDRARYLESLTSEERQKLFNRPYPG